VSTKFTRNVLWNLRKPIEESYILSAIRTSYLKFAFYIASTQKGDEIILDLIYRAIGFLSKFTQIETSLPFATEFPKKFI